MGTTVTFSEKKVKLLNKWTPVYARVCAGIRYVLTCVLVTNLLTGLSGPLATVVTDPLCG